ncbi:integrase, catalytic region, zinc finger, CCHC-type containing protein [Tanacetum coccineum]
MTGGRSRLQNFMKKFIGTVRFENDHFGAIMGYGDYMIGKSVISRVYYVEGLGHNLFSVGQFCDFDLHDEVLSNLLVVQSLQEQIMDNADIFQGSDVSMGRSCGYCLLTPQNRSLIHTLNNKTPYKLVHDKKHDLTFFRVFGALCYPTNDSEDLGKLQPTADIGIFVGYAPSRKGYRIYNKRTRQIMETIHVQFDELTEQMAPVQLSTGPAPSFQMPGQISSGLVPNPVPAVPYVPPTNKELDILFQPMFDELLEPPCVEIPVFLAQQFQFPVQFCRTRSSTTLIRCTLQGSITSIIGITNILVDVLKNKDRLFVSSSPMPPVKNCHLSKGYKWTAFLNGELKEEVYVSQPEGFVDMEQYVTCLSSEGGLTI